MNWQVITVAQSKEIELLGVKEAAALTWLKAGENEYDLVQQEGFNDFIHHNAYNLGELAAMLPYSFVPSNVKEAGEKLIEHLRNGLLTAKDANASLIEAKSQSF